MCVCVCVCTELVHMGINKLDTMLLLRHDRQCRVSRRLKARARILTFIILEHNLRNHLVWRPWMSWLELIFPVFVTRLLPVNLDVQIKSSMLEEMDKPESQDTASPLTHHCVVQLGVSLALKWICYCNPDAAIPEGFGSEVSNLR